MPKDRKKGTRHGFHRLVVAIKTRDLRALDGRCAGTKALLQWKSELLRDLGGSENVSAQRMALVDMIVRTRLYVDHVDTFLMQQGSLINRRRKSVLPLLRERQTLCDSLARLLAQLGLDRVERDGGSIPAEWIEHVRPHGEQESEVAAPANAATKTDETAAHD